VIVDLPAVTFIDSSGLTTLADAHARMSSAGGRLAIDGVAPSIEKVFEITRLTEADPTRIDRRLSCGFAVQVHRKPR